jgi:hypothetical protein
VPDKRFTFDKQRPETDFAHVLRDYREGPQWSHDDHVREFASLVMGASGEALESTVAGLKATNYSIYFHVSSPYHASFPRCFPFPVQLRCFMHSAVRIIGSSPPPCARLEQ